MVKSQGWIRALIIIYYSIFAAGLYLISWESFSFLSFLIALYVGLFLADFISGLVHLYIDYRPLNREKGYDKLFWYQGKRSSNEFLLLKEEIAANSSFFDLTVYNFKIHHREARSNIDRPYGFFFVQTVLPASLFILVSISISLFNPGHPLLSHLAFIELVISIGALHADHIHVWVHGSTAMPLGRKAAHLMQKARLIYSLKTHGAHHKDGDSGFCFVIGHANWLVNWICRQLLARGTITKADWFGEPRIKAPN